MKLSVFFRSVALLLIALLLWTGWLSPVEAQQAPAKNDYWADSLKKGLATATNDHGRVEASLSLAIYYNQLDHELSDQYARQAFQTAELSRDRKLMVMYYLQNGNRYLNYGGIADNIVRAIDSYREAEKIAKGSGLGKDLVESYDALSKSFLQKGNNDQALQYSNLAVAAAAGEEGDTVKVDAYISLGDTYRARNEMLLSFRNYMEAMDVAEFSKNEGLERNVYAALSFFYASIHAIDTAIDYQMKTIRIDQQRNDHITLMGDYNQLAALFASQQQFDLALRMYETAIGEADTVHFELYKVNSYFNIFAMYLNHSQFKKGVDYISKHPEVMDIVDRSGIRFYVDQFYASAYAEMGRYDSANFYFNRARPDVETRAGPYEKSDFYNGVGDYYKKKGDNAGAIGYFLKVHDIGRSVKSLEMMVNSDRELDTLYARTGDYKQAHFYNAEAGVYADSIQTLSRATDLLKLELNNDNRRRERLAREEEANTEHRHNVQYMGFTIGLIVLFLALVMMGWFDISPRTLRALGFVSFIFLFEFIILLADRQIHEWTHGEPWKILLIKIFLAAILLPLHHWLEHTVIHYLTHRKKVRLESHLFQKKPVDKSGAPELGGEMAG